MMQLLQSLKDGSTRLVEAPTPGATGTTLVVRSRASIISAGTERMLVDFGRAGWLEKARSQPDKVKQVLNKVRTDGVVPTLEAVRAKLDAPIPLGYCNAGVVVETGPRVESFLPGDRVVTNGPHAEFVRVPRTLAARIPDGVDFESAAFAPLAAIALQGLRLARPTLGETVVVYGLGLVGLLSVQLARAAGCRVIGIDRDERRLALATQFGATAVAAAAGVDVAQAVLDLTAGIGCDIVLLTLATDSDEPMHSAATMSRKRGRLVLVGVTGLALRRDDFYKKELSFQVSCSYGPGRHDPEYEERGTDYPLPFVRWTEGRNFEAVLSLMADGRLQPLPLVTHRFALTDAQRAYDVVSGTEPSLGIVLSYPSDTSDRIRRRVILHDRQPIAPGRGTVGWIGAGSFSSRTLIPAFKEAGATLDVIASSTGTSAALVGGTHGFRIASSDGASVLTERDVDTVVIATRHDSHADWALRSLGAGKHVFVEKPLALTLKDVERVGDAARGAGRVLCVGFNRRFAPHVLALHDALATRTGPLALSLTMNAGRLPAEHWTQDRDSGGGRIVGEACHFIDLARFLAGAPIESLHVVNGRSATGQVVGDIAMLQLGFANGAVASIHYLANGNAGFPKERVEAFWDGKVVRLDNYRSIKAWGVNGLATRWPGAQDKGHRGLAARFLDAVRGKAEAPIALDELLEVSRWSVIAASLSSLGGGASSGDAAETAS